MRIILIFLLYFFTLNDDVNAKIYTPKFEHKHEESEVIKVQNYSILSIKTTEYIVLSILGGFILNLMPCILPILSIKALSVVKMASLKNKIMLKMSFLGTFVGIVLFFVIIATCVSYMKYIGEFYIWGEYLQNEYCLMLSILLMFYIFGISCNNKINHHETKEAKRTPFLSGLIYGITIPLLSTPCCGPLMSSMVAIAVSNKNNLLSSIIIISIGVGLALPYLLICILKNPANLFPKSGKWVLVIKNISLLIMFFTILWLFHLLLQNEYGLLFLGIVVFVGFFLLFFVKDSNYVIKSIMWLMVAIIVVFLVSNIAKYVIDYKYSHILKPNSIEFNEEKMEKYLFSGKTVVVRFTADWCLSCKVMDLYLFNTQEVKDFFNDNDIIYMVADITSRQQNEASYFMQESKISGVPAVYIASSKNPAGEVYTGLMKKDQFINIISKHL